MKVAAYIDRLLAAAWGTQSFVSSDTFFTSPVQVQSLGPTRGPYLSQQVNLTKINTYRFVSSDVFLTSPAISLDDSWSLCCSMLKITLSLVDIVHPMLRRRSNARLRSWGRREPQQSATSHTSISLLISSNAVCSIHMCVYSKFIIPGKFIIHLITHFYLPLRHIEPPS